MAFDVSHPERLPTQAEYEALSEPEREVLFQSTLTPADSITFVTHEKVGQPFTYDEYCKTVERERAHRNKMTAGSPQGSTAYFGGVDRYRRSLHSEVRPSHSDSGDFPSVEDAFQRAKNFQIDLYDKGLAHVDGLLKKNAKGVSDLNVYLFAACVEGYFTSGPDQAKANLSEVLEFYGSDKTGFNIVTQAIELWSLYRGKIFDHLSQDDELVFKKYFAQKGSSGVLQDPSLQEIDETTQAVISALQTNVPTFVDQLAAVETSATFQDYGRVVFTDMRDVLAGEKKETQFDHWNWWHLYDLMLNYKTPEAKREFCRQIGISVEAMDRALAGETAPESASPKEKEFAASMQKARWEHKGREIYCAGVKLVICVGLGIVAGYTLGPAMGGIAAASGSAAGGAFDVAEVRGRRDGARAQVVSDLEGTGIGSEAYVASLETEEAHAYGAALVSTTLSAGTGAVVFEGGPLVTGALEFGKNHLEADVTGALDGRLTDLEYNNERRQLEGNETPYDNTDAAIGVVSNATVSAVFGGAMTVGMQAAPHLTSGFKTRTRSPKVPESVPRVEVPVVAANNNDGFRTLSFADLPPERQASLRDIDAAYKKYGDEESLVVMPDGDVISVPGKADRAHSTAVKGEQGDGTVQRGRLLAHSQSDTIVPSAEDCRVFLAQAKDRPGEEFVTHITAHAKTPGGDPELLEVRIKYDSATESFDVQAKATSASMVELSQVDAAFGKAQKDFAKLSPDTQESARADMAAMPSFRTSQTHDLKINPSQEKINEALAPLKLNDVMQFEIRGDAFNIASQGNRKFITVIKTGENEFSVSVAVDGVAQVHSIRKGQLIPGTDCRLGFRSVGVQTKDTPRPSSVAVSDPTKAPVLTRPAAYYVQQPKNADCQFVSFTNSLIAACKRNGIAVDTNKLTAFSRYAYAIYLKNNPNRAFAKYPDVWMTITDILDAQNINLKVVGSNSELGLRESRVDENFFLRPLQKLEDSRTKTMTDSGGYLLTLSFGSGSHISGSMSDHAIAIESISADQVTFVDTLNQKQITMSREIFEKDVIAKSKKDGKLTWNAYRFADGDRFVSLATAMERIQQIDWKSLVP